MTSSSKDQPANVTTGRVQFFTTPHHHTLTEDARVLAVDVTVKHDLQDNYLRVDSSISKDHSTDVGLDIAGREKRDTLIATAEAAYRQVSTDPVLLAMLGNQADLFGPFR